MLSIFGNTISFHRMDYAFVFLLFLSVSLGFVKFFVTAFCLDILSLCCKALVLLFMAVNRHLTQLAKKGGNPMDFKFVEHHKVCLLQLSFFV